MRILWRDLELNADNVNLWANLFFFYFPAFVDNVQKEKGISCFEGKGGLKNFLEEALCLMG